MFEGPATNGAYYTRYSSACQNSPFAMTAMTRVSHTRGLSGYVRKAVHGLTQAAAHLHLDRGGSEPRPTPHRAAKSSSKNYRARLNGCSGGGRLIHGLMQSVTDTGDIAGETLERGLPLWGGGLAEAELC